MSLSAVTKRPSQGDNTPRIINDRALSAALDRGFVTPRGYRRFKSRPPSRMAARHEALARDILEIHSDFFIAVYGYRKMHAQLLTQGWTGIGRD